MSFPLRRIAARTATIYAAVAALWIVGSDWLVNRLFSDPATIRAVQTEKGWLFVACTAALLYATLRAEVGRLEVESAARRDAEIALARSEALYRAIARNLPGGAVSVVDGRLEALLDEGPLIVELGRERLDEVGEPSSQVAAVHHDNLRRALAGETLSRELHVDGRAIWARYVPLLGDRGTVLGAMRLALDVTSRERIEQELRAAEERLRQVVESIREVFFLRDARDGCIEYVSPAYDSVFGRSPERLLARAAEWIDAVHPEDRARLASLITSAAHGEGYDTEYRIVRPDGVERWVRELGFPVRDSSGAVVRVSGIAEDVSERRVLLEQLQQTQRLESIGLLAGGVAHDFNNLLTVISGNVELLLLDLEGQPDLAVLAGDVQRAAERASSLTRQLLAFSRREVLEPRLLDLDAVVIETEKMLRRLLGEDIVLEARLGATGTFLRADAGHLVQILMNLAVNARDAMPRGGRLSIATTVATRDEQYARLHPGVEPGRYVELVVADNGCGMTEDVRKRIFEPFFTTKGPGRGTGLGLAVVHGIVRQSGGHLEVESAPGAGARFRMWFPVATGELGETGVRAVEAFGREAVLLVEDDENVRRFAQRGLESFGYAVTAADGSADALRAVEARDAHFEILVTDVVMPGLDGRELADAVRARRPSIRVLFTSGYTDDVMVRRGVLHHEVPFLQKPYTATALARRIREVLDA